MKSTPLFSSLLFFFIPLYLFMKFLLKSTIRNPSKSSNFIHFPQTVSELLWIPLNPLLECWKILWIPVWNPNTSMILENPLYPLSTRKFIEFSPNCYEFLQILSWNPWIQTSNSWFLTQFLSIFIIPIQYSNSHQVSYYSGIKNSLNLIHI